MKKTGLVYDDMFLRHDTGAYHPERPERLTAIFDALQAADLLTRLTIVKGLPAELEWIEKVHTRAYVQRFKDACNRSQKEFEHPDNQICADSFDVARSATGGVIAAAGEIMAGRLDNAFCAVRPPGHHAEPDRAMGFCFFNHVAIAARYLQIEWHIARVGIVDFDVHHGNGTQTIFEDDPSVFYYSIHQHPSFAYPGTGREFETGNGIGTGFTLNSPVLPGKGDEEYERRITAELIPAFAAFKPEVILVSAGFDAHAEDDMADMRLTAQGFRWIMRRIMALGDRYAGGRVISVLEGGYSLSNLQQLVKDHIEILLEA